MIRFFQVCLVLLLPAFLFQGCLQSIADPVYDFSNEGATELLVYMELNGDKINSLDVPWFIEAPDLYNSLSGCLLLDTRPARLYSRGYINNSINVDPGNLLNYLQKVDTSKYSKIVIISATGQASAYYTTLLRLAGYNNVYSLKWGMTSWNRDFAGLWLSSCRTYSEIRNFTNTPGNTNPPGRLPSLNFGSGKGSTISRIRQRVNGLLASGFNDYDSVIYSSQFIQNPSVDYRTAIENGVGKNVYLVCYGNDNLYNVTDLFSPYRGLGHPEGAVLYALASALRSNDHLNTLPAGKEIILYCFNGQYSAAAAAYLRVLGYNAKSLNFGAHILFYDRLKNYSPTLNRYVFDPSFIMDYPYESRYN